MDPHLPQEILGNRVTRPGADDGINAAMRAEGRHPDAIACVAPFRNSSWRKNFKAVKASAHLAREYLIAVANRMSVSSDMSWFRCVR